MPRLGMFYGSRIGDKAVQRKLFDTLLGEFARALDAMERATAQLLTRLAEHVAEAGARMAPVA